MHEQQACKLDKLYETHCSLPGGCSSEADLGPAGVAHQYVQTGIMLLCVTGVEPTVLNKGAVLCHPDWPVPLVGCVLARLLVLDVPRPILKGQQVPLKSWHGFNRQLSASCLSGYS